MYVFWIQTFMEFSVRSQADCRDTRTETSGTTHDKKYRLCKKFGKVIIQWTIAALNKQQNQFLWKGRI